MKRRTNEKTHFVALTAIFAALSVAILALGAVIDVLDMSAAALCSLLVWYFQIEYGWKKALSLYIVTSVLAIMLLFFINMFSPLLYALFCGFYPILKYYIDRIRSLAVRLIIKIGIFACCAGAVYLISKLLLTNTGFEDFTKTLAILFIALAILAFLMLDFAMTKMVFSIFPKLRKMLRKSGLIK